MSFFFFLINKKEKKRERKWLVGWLVGQWGNAEEDKSHK